jgi:hypothetical protein
LTAKGTLMIAEAVFIICVSVGLLLFVKVYKFLEPAMSTVGFNLSNVWVLNLRVPVSPRFKARLLFGLIILTAVELGTIKSMFLLKLR